MRVTRNRPSAAFPQAPVSENGAANRSRSITGSDAASTQRGGAPRRASTATDSLTPPSGHVSLPSLAAGAVAAAAPVALATQVKAAGKSDVRLLGDRLLVRSKDVLHLLDAATGTSVATLGSADGDFCSDPTGELIASLNTETSTLSIFNGLSGERISAHSVPGSVALLGVSNGAGRALLAGSDGRPCVYNCTHDRFKIINVDNASASALAPTGRTAVVLSRGQLIVWERKLQRTHSLALNLPAGDRPETIAYASSGRWAAVLSQSGVLTVIDMENPAALLSVATTVAKGLQLRSTLALDDQFELVSRDSHRFIDTDLVMRESVHFPQLKVKGKHSGLLGGVCYDSGSAQFLVSYGDSRVLLCDAVGNAVRQIGFPEPVTVLGFYSEGTSMLAMGAATGTFFRVDLLQDQTTF